MTPSEISLIEPTAALEAEYLAMAREYLAAGEERYTSALDNFPAYYERLENLARGENLPPDRVRENIFWLVSAAPNGDKRVLGTSRLRHWLIPALEREGGHIGYDVRPTERRRGYGTLILKLTLERAQSLGLRRALLTCDADNGGSVKVIKNNGGVLGSRAISDQSGKPILRYWIEL